ncbi:uncharacterized protein LOC105689742 [Athalia rosae]|uniref:uncharacterized protein LOC105689742 n=1 Tax=Athalia rosae TaxID=37344 RepID=UPI002033CCD0|nr:uncharacterized protein LOC105689742 [Athalia rosae]
MTNRIIIMLNTIRSKNFYVTRSPAHKVELTLNSFFHTKVMSDRQNSEQESTKSFAGLEFLAKYDKPVTEKILNILNKNSTDELSKYDISKGRLVNVDKYRKVNGGFKTISDLLEVDDFGTKVLERLVKSIATESTNKVEKTKNIKTKLPRGYSNITIPIIDDDKKSKIKTMTSIYAGAKHISWAKLGTDGCLMSWDSHSNFEWPKKNNPMLLRNLAVTIHNKLPESDVYLMEEAPTRQYSSNQQKAVIFQKMQQSQFTMMLMALVATKSNTSNENGKTSLNGVDNFYFLQQLLTAELFQLNVGNERTSAQNLIGKIGYEGLFQSSKHITPISIAASEINVYNQCDLLRREALSEVLLISAAFLDLVIRCNPLSLNSLGGKFRSR